MNSKVKPALSASKQPGLLHKVGGDLWQFFTSIRLAIVLISSISLISLVGTFFPQANRTRAVDYIQQYGVAGYGWIQSLQLDRVFRSGYFIFFMVLFFINMLCCTFKRFRASSRYVKLKQHPMPPQAFGRMPLHAEVAWSGRDETQWAEALTAALRKKRYRVRQRGGQWLAEKWRWERFGIDVFHVGILVLLVGGLLTATLGYRQFPVAQRGDVLSVPQRDFAVRVDDFWSENYAQSERVMDWHSTLSVIEGGREVTTQTIEVNHPLYYKGIRFYQSSFGQDWKNSAQLTLRVEDAEGTSLGTYQAKVNTRFDVPGAGIQVRVGAFLPDFALSENQIAYSRSQRLDNPAVFLQVYDGAGRFLHRTWAFSHMPELQRVLPNAPYRFFLSGMTAPEFTGLQVNYDPGVNVALAGFVLMILGIVVNLYFDHRRIWIHVDPHGRRLLLGGKARRPSQGFEREFERLLEQFEPDSSPA